MLCFIQNFQLGVLFLNRNKMKTKSSYLLESFHATFKVALDLRIQEFGSMKDSGGGESPLSVVSQSKRSAQVVKLNQYSYL